MKSIQIVVHMREADAAPRWGAAEEEKRQSDICGINALSYLDMVGTAVAGCKEPLLG